MFSFKKINKGLILTIITLLGLLIYIVGLETYRGKEKENIKKACEEYIAFNSNYQMFDEQYRSVTKKINEDELNKYVDKIKDEVKQYTVSNDRVVELEMNILKRSLREQLDMNEITTSYKKEIYGVKSYVFEDNQVTVTLDTFYEKEVEKWVDDVETETTKVSSKKSSGNVEDVIVLKNEDGNWKVVYSNITNNENSSIDATQSVIY